MRNPKTIKRYAAYRGPMARSIARYVKNYHGGFGSKTAVEIYRRYNPTRLGCPKTYKEMKLRVDLREGKHKTGTLEYRYFVKNWKWKINRSLGRPDVIFRNNWASKSGYRSIVTEEYQ